MMREGEGVRKREVYLWLCFLLKKGQSLFLGGNKGDLAYCKKQKKQKNKKQDYQIGLLDKMFKSLSSIGVVMFIITLTIPNSTFRVEFCDLLTYCLTEILSFKYECITFNSLRTLSYLW